MNAYELLKVSGVIHVTKKYRKGQFVKVKVTGIQPYGAFVKTPDNQEGLIHISEVMNDYVHDVNQFLSKGQIVKAKVLSVDKNGKLNLTLKDNEYFRNEERKRDRRSVLDQIKDTEKYGFESLRQKMPQWIETAKRRIK
nr:S1 domain-containing post-transcriptional regulator Ygs [Salinicoccus sp. ID82-1]